MSESRKIEVPPLEPRKALLERMLKQRAVSAPARRVPASYAQRRMWLLTALNPDAPTYNLHYALRMRGPLDLRALENALTRVVRRHETLRTTFEAVDGQPEQVVQADLRVPLDIVDLSHLPKEARIGAARQMGIEERRRPFDLAHGPLLRVILQRLAEDEHILFLVLHHIVADGWSIGLLFRELHRLYDGGRQGSEDPLPPLPLQFSDFTRKQMDMLAGDTLRSQLEYWKQQLVHLPAPLDLPIDGRRGTTPTREAETRSHLLGATRLEALKQLSRTAGVTPYATVLMVLKVLLQRICGEDDVVVGSPIAARTMAHTEKLIGFFVNMLVIRTSLAGNPTFRALLERVREVTRGAFGHQDLPFERLLEELNPERDLGRTPLFQVYLNMLNFQESAPAFAGLETEALPPYEIEANFDLTLYVREQSGGLELAFVYPRGLFSGQRIEELLRQFETVLVAAIEDPDQRIGDVSLLTGQSRTVLPDPAPPLVSTVGAAETLDARHLSATADRIALSGADGDWTGGELDARADHVAQLLLRGGLQRGEIVAVLARRDPWLVCALLGVLRAGGAFAILDPAYPEATLVARWRAANPRGLILLGDRPRAELEAAIEGSDLRVRLHLPQDALVAPPEIRDRVTRPELCADDLAYVVFTSGTTGGVKAVLGTHGPVAHFLNWQKQTFDLGPEDRFSLLSGLSHDPLLRDVFAPLWAGGTLSVPGAELLAEPTELAEWMRARRITVAHLTPAMAQMLATVMKPGHLEDLRYAFLAGDVLRADTVGQLQRVGPRATCVNFYGATETPQAMSFYVVPPKSPDVRERIPVGRGIDGVQLLVMTDGGRLAGVGELGEIVVRTPYLSRGYLGDRDLTSARFTRNPFRNAADDLVYRTGDLGRYLPDGSVEFAGRRDTQVKLRGFRIELGEIEAALCKHPAVAAAAAGLHGGAPGDERLVAWVVPTAGDTMTTADLRTFLAKRLPDYAVPTAWATIAELPLTPNGKLDRRALPAPELEPQASKYQPPQSPTEELVAGVYAEVLGLARVGRLDGFFELGGHSLLAAQVTARLNARLGVQLSLRALFEQPTVAALAAHLDTLQQGSSRHPPLARRSLSMPAPLSFAQQRLWFIHELAPEIAAYNLAGALEFRGRLDVAALRSALDCIVARHETLRTTIGRLDGQPVQVVSAASSCALQVVDLDGDAAQSLASRLRSEALRPFDLEAGPLLRMTLYRRTPEQHVLLLVAHHIISDGWSMGVLARELGELYRNIAQGAEPGLPPLSVQYADFAAWQRTWLVGEELERELEYWRSQLAGAPAALELPTDRPRPATFSHRGARYNFTLPQELADALTALSRREGVTLFMVLLGAFQVLLSRYSGQDDVVVGSPVANRSRPEIEGLIGFFVNTLVLRTALSNVRTFRELLGRVRETCLGAYAHQELPFEKLVQALRPERDTSRNPVFQVMLVLQNMALPPLELEGVTVAPLDIERTTSQVDLTLYLRETGDGVLGTFEFATDLFDVETIEGLARHLRQLLEGFAAAPDADLSAVSMMRNEERRALLRGCDTARDYPRDRTVVELFAEQAARRPQAVALTHAGEDLDYAGLAARSNRLAAYLRSLDVGPGSLVGVCVERGPDMVVALLGILKAGGAYLPLDPAFPAERLLYMLADSGAAALVTHSRLDCELFAGAKLRRVCLDTDREAIERQSPVPLATAAGRRDRAYVLYTSGSTGRPKGVEITHGALTNFLYSMAREPGLADDDVLVAVTTLSFDISILELFLPLTTGARVVIAEREVVADGVKLKALLAASAATIMQATPSLWRLLLDSGWQGAGRFTALCGGEPFPPDLVRRLCECCGAVWNMYGPTETTIWSTCERITDPDAPVSIGKPIANTRAYVLDHRLEPVPPLVPGELFIAGDGVALGYLNRPELTAERFLPDPFAEGVADARMYRTGDKVRRLRDGRLQHLGRLDQQVKVRGFRIEVGEIESVLCGHSAVSEAAVNVWEPAPGDQRLAAYVVPRNAAPSVTELRKHARSLLPDYMIPQHFALLDRLPRTPNGKLDRRALPPPLHTPSGPGDAAEPPVGPTETLIAGIWKEVIGGGAIARSDNFFDAGGHSLLAIQAIARIEERTGWRPSPRLLILENLKEIALQCDQAVQRPAAERTLLSRLKGLVGAAD